MGKILLAICLVLVLHDVHSRRSWLPLKTFEEETNASNRDTAPSFRLQSLASENRQARGNLLKSLATALWGAATVKSLISRLKLDKRHSNSGGSSSVSSPLRRSFGGKSLEFQPIPKFLHEYHATSLALSELALNNDTVKCNRQIPYGSGSRTLDVWEPAEGGSNLPIVVGIHGGGWEVGYPEWAGFLAPNVCSAPALYITPSYTLGNFSQRAWPASRDDLVEALRWIVDNAKSYGGDPTRIVLTGHSAGGHLAACVGLSPDVLQEAGIPPTSIKALFLVSCPIGLRAQDFSPKWLWHLRITRSLIRRLYQKVLPSLSPVVGNPADPVISLAASPLANLDVSKVASLPELIHITFGGKRDFPVCKPHAKQLRRKLKNRVGGPKVEILELPKYGHFDTHYALAEEHSEWNQALHRALRTI